MAAPRVAFASQSLPAYARTVGRAVHVKIHPRPRNLSESREVLRVLQQYGEVIMYKHLKHEPGLRADNSALAIYQNVEAAQKIMDASPLRFELGGADATAPLSTDDKFRQYSPANPTELAIDGQSPSIIENASVGPKVHRQVDYQEDFNEDIRPKKETISAEDGWAAFKGLAGTISQAPTPPTPQANSIGTITPRSPKPFTSNPTPSISSLTDLPYTSSKSLQGALGEKPAKREFHLSITRSILNHQAYIQRQHYYGGWRLDDKTLMADDLRGRVPVEGFRDCDLAKGETPMRVRLQRREREQQEEWEGDSGAEIVEHFGRRKKTLAELWEEGMVSREQERKGRVEA